MTPTLSLAPVNRNARRVRKNVCLSTGLRLHIRKLLEDRDTLLEEISQLRAAVHIYTELARRMQSEAPRAGSDPFPLRAA